MGSSESKKQDQTSNGAINNNLIIEDTVNVHSTQVVSLLYAIVVLMIINLLLQVFKEYKKSQKKRYMRRAVSSTQLNKISLNK